MSLDTLSNGTWRLPCKHLHFEDDTTRLTQLTQIRQKSVNDVNNDFLSEKYNFPICFYGTWVAKANFIHTQGHCC